MQIKQSDWIKRTTQRFHLNQNKHEKAITLTQSARKKYYQTNYSLKITFTNTTPNQTTHKQANRKLTCKQTRKSKWKQSNSYIQQRYSNQRKILKQRRRKTDKIKEKYSKNIKKHTFDSLTPHLKSKKIIRTKEMKNLLLTPLLKN